MPRKQLCHMCGVGELIPNKYYCRPCAQNFILPYLKRNLITAANDFACAFMPETRAQARRDIESINDSLEDLRLAGIE